MVSTRILHFALMSLTYTSKCSYPTRATVTSKTTAATRVQQLKTYTSLMPYIHMFVSPPVPQTELKGFPQWQRSLRVRTANTNPCTGNMAPKGKSHGRFFLTH